MEMANEAKPADELSDNEISQGEKIMILYLLRPDSKSGMGIE